MSELNVGKGDIFWPFDDDTLWKVPVLASVLKKLTAIIRAAMKCPVYAGILLVFVRFSIIFN